MNRSTSRRRLLTGAGGAALAATAGCSFVERDEAETVQRRFDVEEIDAVSIASDTGDLSVRSGDPGELRIQGEKRAASGDAIDSLSLTDRRDGSRLGLGTDVGDGPWPVGWLRTPRLHVDVAVPPSVRVEEAVASPGDLEVENVAGPLTAEADTGDLYVADVDGAVDARVDAGRLIVRDATGSVVARADTGTVNVDGVIAGIRSGTGDVSATVRGIDGAPTIETDTGDVGLALSRSLDVTVSASVDTGSIDVPGGESASVRTNGNSRTVVLGDGSGEIEVATDTGDVSITLVE